MRFTDVAAEADVPERTALRVLVDGSPVALFRAPHAIVAFDDRCPHAGAPLSEGICRDGFVVCSWHGFRFDAATGACPLFPGAPSACPREARVEKGRVLVGTGSRSE
jgi:vanillate O-demethylase monooxygenase subunit